MKAEEKRTNGTRTDVTVKLSGVGGNAFVILGKVIEALKRAGVFQTIIDDYKREAMSGDYKNLLQVTADYVIVE